MSTSPGELERVYERSLAHFLAPIGPLLADAGVTEILINGPHEVYVERAGRLERSDACFRDSLALEAAIRNVAQYVGKRLSPDTSSLEARLPDGSRVHVVSGPASRRGLCVAIRKFSEERLGLAALVERGSLSREAADLLGGAVAIARNVLVCGGSGSGKTTLLNALSARIPAGERILVLEDASELQLDQEHVLQFEAQPAERDGSGAVTIRELFRASLRMRPDRIIVGECRGGEALDMIQAMTSGHSGSLSTAHATSPRDALHRLETLALLAGVEIPLPALRAQVASAVDVIVQTARLGSGRRVVTEIAEVLPLTDRGDYQLAELYRFDAAAGALAATGTSPSFRDQLALRELEASTENPGSPLPPSKE